MIERGETHIDHTILPLLRLLPFSLITRPLDLSRECGLIDEDARGEYCFLTCVESDLQFRQSISSSLRFGRRKMTNIAIFLFEQRKD